jgi:hypothetical protein
MSQAASTVITSAMKYEGNNLKYLRTIRGSGDIFSCLAKDLATK